MGLSNKLFGIDFDMGSSFPIQFFLLVGVSSSDGMQTGYKPKLAAFLNKICSLVCSIMKSSKFSN